MSIPKIIHYCWFGGNPLPPLVKKCMRSWKKYCPDYQIILWNEENFDVSQYPYMQEAYELKKWAFVTDVARLLVVYQYGGIYLDTDVELRKPLDPFLSSSGFFGFEFERIATGLGFGAEPGNTFVKAMLDGYEGKHFLKEDGTVDKTSCPIRNTADLVRLGLKPDGSYQNINGTLFLPEEYMCPMNWKTREIHLTPNTVSIHRYSASWKPKDEQLQNFLKPILGARIANKLIRMKQSFCARLNKLK